MVRTEEDMKTASRGSSRRRLGVKSEPSRRLDTVSISQANDLIIFDTISFNIISFKYINNIFYHLPFENTEAVFYAHFSAYCAGLVWQLAYSLLNYSQIKL